MIGLATLKAKLIAGAVIGAVAFGAGWKVNGWRYEAKLARAAELARAEYERGTEESLRVASNITIMLDEARRAANASRRTFKRELNSATNRLATCTTRLQSREPEGAVEHGGDTGSRVTLSDDGQWLWQRALYSGLPEGFYPERVDGGTGTTGEPVPLGLAFVNLEENSAICNRLRVQLRGWQQLARDKGWVVQ